MIVVNRIGDIITGSVNGEQFGVPFTKELFKKMSDLEEAAENAANGKEVLTICESFQKLLNFNYEENAVSDVHPDIYVSPKGYFYLQINKKVINIPMPKALVERIRDSKDKGIDVTPLIKFWTRFLRNPKIFQYRNERFAERVFNYVNAKYTNYDLIPKLMEEKGVSEEVATELATTYQVKITKEGLLNTFKVSKEITTKFILDDKGNKQEVARYQGKQTIDENTGLVTYEDTTPETVEERLFEPPVMGKGGDAFYCEGPNGFKEAGHFIRVGCTHRLESWALVDTNDSRSCVPGLHVGGLDYIKGYQGSNTVTHNVFVDPAHIGAVPDDRAGAIRCIQYFVHSSFAGVNGSIYNSSEYAKQTDAKWASEKAELLKQFGVEKTEALKEIEEETDLIESI